MAKIKTAFGKYSSNANVDFARTQCGAVVSHDRSVVWVGDSGLDYDTLNPFFDKPCGALQAFGGNEYIPDLGTSLLTTKPVAHAGHNSYFDNQNATYAGRIGHMPETWMKNLDKSGRMDNGTIYRFLDSGGNPHSLVIYNRVGTNVDSNYVLFAGDNLENPANVTKGSLANPATATSGSLLGHMYQPIHTDAVNKVIYAYAWCYRSSYPATTMYEIFKIPFTTIPIDGTLSLGTPVPLALGYQGNGRYMDANPSWYCGNNNAGDACFITQIENESIYTATSASSNRLPTTAIKTANQHRIRFNKYDPVTNTVTGIADLKGTEGFVGNPANTTTVAADHISHYTMSHFEPSPIGGETDIYYAYSPCLDSVAGTYSLLLFTWDKANDTFAAEAVSMSFNGSDVISDFITQCEATTIDNEEATLNVALTKDGANYYVHMFWTHASADGLALFSGATQQKMLTMSINAADFSSLSYHSDIAFPALAYAPQDSNNTKWFVIEASAATLYSFSAVGWAKTASEAGTCRAISQDQDSRYWSLMLNAGDYSDITTFPEHFNGSYKPFNVSLHLLSADLPTSVSVVFEDDTITYAGNNLTKNLLVNAYDTNGSRVAKSVTLKITGSNAVFQSNNATSLTTTTSAAGDLSVPLTISGAGFINISASFAI